MMVTWNWNYGQGNPCGLTGPIQHGNTTDMYMVACMYIFSIYRSDMVWSLIKKSWILYSPTEGWLEHITLNTTPYAYFW